MDTLSRLVEALRCLPGVGPKSAQRMVYHLLQHQRQRGLQLAACLTEAMHEIHHCPRCNNYTTESLCNLCQNTARDKTTVCVVESPADLAAIEQSQVYQGQYYVLMGKISPLDGLGPEEIGLPNLVKWVVDEGISEVILALNHSVESQTTCHFIHDYLRPHAVKISQLAHGIPSGGELEFLDSYTIRSALHRRATFNLNDTLLHE